MKIGKVSIVGCGALGMMYASSIMKKLPECEIRFIADNTRIERYLSAGFTVNGERCGFTFVPPDGDGPSDLVIFAVKWNDLTDAAALAENHIGTDTIIMSFLNGVSSEAVLAKTYRPEKILHSIVAGMDATRTGTELSYTAMGYIVFGGANPGVKREDIECVAEFFTAAGLRNEPRGDILKALWWKYMLNLGINQCSALLRAPYGLFQTSEHARSLMRMTMLEAYDVARAVGIMLDESDITRAMDIIGTLSPDGKTSMCQDVTAGRRTEIDMFAGELMALGERHGIATPVNAFLYNAIKALETPPV